MGPRSLQQCYNRLLLGRRSRTSSDGQCGSVSRRCQRSDALVVPKQGAHVSVGEEVAGGDAADGLMDVHASDLSGSSAVKDQPLLL